MNKNIKIYVLIAAGILLVGVIGASFAYFAASITGIGNADVTVSLSDQAEFVFTKGDDLALGATMSNFADGEGNVASTTTAIAALTATGNYTGEYYVYFEITENDFEYTTTESTPELVLQIFKIETVNEEEVKTEITSGVTGLTYIGTGFDVTTASGVFAISELESITAYDTTTTEEWEFTLTFVNLDSDQNANSGKTFVSNALLQVDKIYTRDDVVNESGTLTEQILLQNYFDENEEIVDLETATTYINSKTTPTFSSAATTDEGIFETTDTDGGSSYYFRGAVDDNWVYYAGCYWRIIRIDEDGNVRMIYSGTTQPTESQAVVMTGTGTQLSSTSTYNGDTSVYVTDADGSSYLMSKTLLGAQYVYTTGELHGDDNSSVIKGVVDTWFTTTIKSNEEYYQYIETTTYCNDRTYYTSSSNYSSGYTTDATYFYGSTTTIYYYGAYYRMRTYYSPTLDCTNSSDELELEVALITADEVSLAGGLNSDNTSYYLYTNSNYWTLSPSSLASYNAYVFYVKSSGYLNVSNVPYGCGVRPVVSLKSEISNFTGSGTWDEPYVIG